MHGWDPYHYVHRERIRAHAKHDAGGGSMERKAWDDPAWLPVLVEEVGEVARALCECRHLRTDDVELRAQLRSELIQVAAMTCAWLEAVMTFDALLTKA
jgi:NTP pyrophosphatase (non-canonical NTP hydrolase)